MDARASRKSLRGSLGNAIPSKSTMILTTPILVISLSRQVITAI